jgi:hypothetical protein
MSSVIEFQITFQRTFATGTMTKCRNNILTAVFLSPFQCIIFCSRNLTTKDIISHAKTWEDADQRLSKTSPVKSSGISAGFRVHLHTQACNPVLTDFSVSANEQNVGVWCYAFQSLLRDACYKHSRTPVRGACLMISCFIHGVCSRKYRVRNPDMPTPDEGIFDIFVSFRHMLLGARKGKG